MTTERGLVIWRFTDGKRGHERQTEGLAAALAARIRCEVHDVRARTTALGALASGLSGRFDPGSELPAPQLILGAGRACQWPMLAARRVRGGRAIYLMRPALPVACFDLCIIPAHDTPRKTACVIVSDGPLNPVRRARAQQAGAGLILIGGPSPHYRWDTEGVVRDIRHIAARRPDINWQLTDSRRSPAALGTALASLALENVTYCPHGRTGPDWLPDALSRAAHVWVSADSVAMVYEAMTAGAGVGIIDVPARRRDRITAVAPDLIKRGQVADLASWLEHGRIAPPDAAPEEANRCAALILERWPDLAAAPASQ